MIPLLNIIAPQASEAPTQVGAATNGQPSGDGLFAQMFAEAMGTVPQQTAIPTIGIPVNGVVGTGVRELQVAVAELLPISGDSEVVSDDVILPQTETVENLPIAKDQETITALPSQDVNEVMPVRENVASAAVVTAPNVQIGNPVFELTAKAFPISMESTLVGRIETELATLTDKNSNGVMINANVDMSDDAAKVLSGEVVNEKPSVGPQVVAEDAAPVIKSSVQQVPKNAGSLKSELKRSFPSLNIESASAKVNVQIKLNNAQSEVQAKPEVATIAQRVVVASDLPIAAAPQFVAATAISGQASKPVKLVRDAHASAMTVTPSDSKPMQDIEDFPNAEPRLVARKPVQMALKQQGFDIEKLINAGGNAKETLVENLAIDKTDFKVAVDKQVTQVTDNSFELNGTERFKLDIKQSHIEALLKKGEIKIQLQPEHLGNLKIRLMTTPTEVNARLETSSEDARRAVEHSLPQLRESFERAGLRLNSIEVSVNDDSNSRRQSAFQQEWRGRNSESRANEGKFSADIPATAEISQNLYTAYGGALNLVA